MLCSEAVIQRLISSGELWESSPGIIGLRGGALAKFRAAEAQIAELCSAESREEWQVPSALPLATLAKAEYFASFPQWLTLAAHLSDDEAVLERIAADPKPADAAARAIAPTRTALPPAVCYHVYEGLAGTVVRSPRLVTAQGTCWRHEGDRLRPLERGWAFTMREVVCIGSAEQVDRFRRRMIAVALRLAAQLNLAPTIDLASDPFFAPTARGKALLQRLKCLKHELLLPLGNGRLTAAASFNHHETFFGEAFDIRLPDGSPAQTACAAFGLERWLLAILVQSSAPEEVTRAYSSTLAYAATP
jgi:seryl-tRNA synthetase